MTDNEIEMQMNKALKKVPLEVRKIKIILFFIKKWKNLLNLFKLN